MNDDFLSKFIIVWHNWSRCSFYYLFIHIYSTHFVYLFIVTTETIDMTQISNHSNTKYAA